MDKTTAPARATLWMLTATGGWQAVLENRLLADCQQGHRVAVNNGKDAKDLRILPVGEAPAV